MSDEIVESRNDACMHVRIIDEFQSDLQRFMILILTAVIEAQWSRTITALSPSVKQENKLQIIKK